MTENEAKNRIFRHLCEDYKKNREKARVEREGLAGKLEIPQELFDRVFIDLTSRSGQLYVKQFGDRLEFLQLGSSWVHRCIGSN